MAAPTTTLHVDFVSESAGFCNTFGWYNKATGQGGILFSSVEAEGSNAPLTPGSSGVDFTVNTADLGNLQYFLIPDGSDLNNSSDLNGPVKVIQLSDGHRPPVQKLNSCNADHGLCSLQSNIVVMRNAKRRVTRFDWYRTVERRPEMRSVAASSAAREHSRRD